MILKKKGIVQGDAYVLPIVISTGDTIITDSIATAVRIKVGKYSASWPGGKISYSDGKWLFPLTQEQTQNLSSGKDEYQVQVQFFNGETIGTTPAPIRVIKSVLRGTFGVELEAASSKDFVEFKQLNAYISDVNINVGGSGGSPYSVLFIPQTLTEEEKAQARENIGIEDELPEVDEEDNGKILAVVGGKWVATENTSGGDIPNNVVTTDMLGSNLVYSGGKINVATANGPEADNTKPITAAAVYEIIGDINALLSTI